ncbi:MAG: Purine nucleoside phosphorylase 1 [Firmicutes bacterium ADurb.Bin182]|nr:MAG: Purine nucleoside phosphorylase 1 [Firmicutes bacterium ADurb.Bin182]
MPDILERIERAYSFIRSKTDSRPGTGLILGSGLGDFCDSFDKSVVIPFGEIPDFPAATVEGHRGAFVIGNCGGKSVAALRGRLHYYEGYSQSEITMPVRVMKKLGVETLIITNAAGGINLSFSEGALMLISDHINYSGSNPLIGKNLDEFGPRFPDMSDVYSKEARVKIKEMAEDSGINLYEGVYAMYSGPSFETPAEIRFLRLIGADAVGMSTVPEAIVARHCGMEVIGISLITNMAAGILEKKLSHLEVIETANRVKASFARVLDLAVSLG